MSLTNRKGCDCTWSPTGGIEDVSDACPDHGRLVEGPSGLGAVDTEGLDALRRDKAERRRDPDERQSDWIRDLPSHEQHEHW